MAYTEKQLGQIADQIKSIDDFLLLTKQIETETAIAPKFNEWRNHYSYKIAYGGRGAGAKTESAFSLAVQFGESPRYFGNKVNILVTREVQNTIDLSSYETVVKKIRALRYGGWTILKKEIRNDKNGSRFSFRGLSDLTADNFRALQDIDILIVEEAHSVGYKAWKTVLPSMRKKGCEVWVLFNRVLEVDPCYDLFVQNQRPNSCILALEPGDKDNPWFNDSELPEKRDADYKRDPDEAAHIWEGLPRKQGERSIMSRVDIRDAMDRKLELVGEEQVGVDVARYGDDSTEMVRRKGMQVVKTKSMRKADTNEVADAVWDFADHDYNVKIVIDEGYNPGVIDVLKKKGANVFGVQFGGSAMDKDTYPNAVSEMWFTFPIDAVGLPDDQELMMQLSDRRYTYNKKDQRMVESKGDYKTRHGGKSSDKADAVLLAFYKPNRIAFSSDFREAMAKARGR